MAYCCSFQVLVDCHLCLGNIPVLHLDSLVILLLFGGWCSKEKLIDESSRNSSKDWSRPVHPVVVPEAHHSIGSEGTGRVHAGSSERDGKKVAGCDGQSNSERCRALDTGRVVLVSSGGKHNKHQHHCDQELDSEALSGSDMAECCCAKSMSSSTTHRYRNHSTQNSGSSNATNDLHHNVGKASQKTTLGTSDKSSSDGRVDVAA